MANRPLRQIVVLVVENITDWGHYGNVDVIDIYKGHSCLNKLNRLGGNLGDSEFKLKLSKWYDLASRLRQVKNEEANLRREICEEIFEGATGEFTKKQFVDSVEIKAKSTVNRSLDVAILDAIWENLTEAERSVIAYKPYLKTGDYKKAVKAGLIDTLFEAITEKPGMPTLEIINNKEV
jgi:hypothetical protein